MAGGCIQMILKGSSNPSHSDSMTRAFGEECEVIKHLLLGAYGSHTLMKTWEVL